MNSLVFVEDQSVSAEPFTTSEIISEQTGVTKRYIREAIHRYKSELESFGILALYATSIRSGKRGQPEKIYKLNEQQATFLMTLLKNTPVVIQFKQLLVKQFYAMRKELTKRQIARAQSKPPQRTFTDVIKACTPPEYLKPYTYQNYTNMAFKAALGLSAGELRRDRHIPDSGIVEDYMTKSELDAVNDAKNRIVKMLLTGATYFGIKRVMIGMGD